MILTIIHAFYFVNHYFHVLQKLNIFELKIEFFTKCY